MVLIPKLDLLPKYGILGKQIGLVLSQQSPVLELMRLHLVALLVVVDGLMVVAADLLLGLDKPPLKQLSRM